MSKQPEALRMADELEMWTLGEPAAARYATPADMAAGAKFCTINVSLDGKSMIAKVCSRGLTLSADRGGNIRLACHGTIENIKLGEFHFQSSGGFSFSGVFIDYAENEDALLQRAVAFLREQQKALAQRARDLAHSGQLLEIK